MQKRYNELHRCPNSKANLATLILHDHYYMQDNYKGVRNPARVRLTGMYGVFGGI